MLQQLNVVGNSWEPTLVLKRKADILSISYGISSVTQLLTYVKYLIIINYQSLNYGAK